MFASKGRFPFGLAGWGQQEAKIQPKKKLFKKKDTKMIRMVKFIQKTEDFNFSLLGGVRVEIPAVSHTF